MANQALTNDPARKGELAAPKRIFGPHGRYAVAPVHTRFDALIWMVWDAEAEDPYTGGPEVIRMGNTEEEAIAGLDGLES